MIRGGPCISSASKHIRGTVACSRRAEPANVELEESVTEGEETAVLLLVGVASRDLQIDVKFSDIS